MKKIHLSLAIGVSIVLNACGGAKEPQDDPYEGYKTALSGVVYEDSNNNSKKDENEKGQDNIELTIVDAKGTEYKVHTGLDGEYHIQGINPGEATISLNKATLPSDFTLVNEENEIEITLEENKDTSIPAFGYKLKQEAEPELEKGHLIGRIFQDFDESYDYSLGEKGIEGVDVTLLDVNGDMHQVKTDKEGNYIFENMLVGAATISINDDEIKNGLKPSVSNREGRSTQDFIKDKNLTIIIVKSKRTQAEDIGFFSYTDELGIVAGTIFFDTNDNGKYDNTDQRLENISVTVRDVNGVIHSAVSRTEKGHVAFKGTYQVAVPPGEVTIIVDQNDPDLPEYSTIIGYNPDTATAKPGEKIFAGGFGFKK